MIAVAIPTAFEAEPFVRKLQNRKGVRVGELRCVRGTLGGVDVVVGLTKIGQPHTEKLCGILLRHYQPKHVILAGFAGALDPELPRGKVICCQGDAWEGVIYTAKEVVATPKDKARLWEETGCQIVDMESEYMAKSAKASGVSYSIVRVVSDAASDEVPVAVLDRGYDRIAGKETPLRMAAHLCFHPSSICVLMDFLKMTGPNRHVLADALTTYMREMGVLAD